MSGHVFSCTTHGTHVLYHNVRIWHLAATRMYITTCSQQIGPVLIHLSRSILAGGALALHFVTPCVNYNSLEILLSPRDPRLRLPPMIGCCSQRLLPLMHLLCPLRFVMHAFRPQVWLKNFANSPSDAQEPCGSSSRLGNISA